MGNLLACIRRRSCVSGLRTGCELCFQRIPKELRAKVALKLFECQIDMENNPRYSGPKFQKLDINFLLLLDWLKSGDTKFCPVCGQAVAEGSSIDKLIRKWT